MTAPLPHVAAMAPYAIARMQPPAGVPLISLAQNESLRPPAPAVAGAVARAAGQAALYPDPDWRDLRAALAAFHEVPAAGILCGAGSLDLIGALMRGYAGPGRAVLIPAHAYPFFATAAQAAGARVDRAPEVVSGANATVSVDALLAGVRPDTRVVCVANPGNPTGTRISLPDMARLRAGLPAQVLLVIDEAYGEVSEPGRSAAFDMVGPGATVVLRTFSKAYGLAGLRVGWGLFPETIADELRKLLNPNAVSAPAQAAALAALADTDYMRETCALTRDLRDRTAADLRAAGLAVADSFTNFILLDLGSAARAARAAAALQASGIFLRAQAGAGLPGALRMTIGPAEHVNMAAARLIRWAEEDRT